MGIIYRFQGDPERAKQMFEKAIGLHADFSSAYVNLALIERDEGHPQKALERLDQAVKADSSNAEAYAQIAATYRQQGRLREAEQYYGKALKLCDTNPVYQNGLGITLEAAGRLDDAFSAYCRAVELDGGYADAYNNRANVYVKLGKHWEAEDDYKRAIKLDPRFASAFNNLGALLYDQERYEEALECYRKAFLINPKQAETCSNLAKAVKEAGDPAEAVGLYFTALHLNPSLTKIHHYLAQTLYDLYQSPQADGRETAFRLAEKWVAFFPDNPVAIHVCKALKGDHPERASAEYVRELFDSFADSFETTLKKIKYHVPDLLAREIEKLPPGLRILDAGCGTGLNAGVLKPHASFLAGVDLSGKMLDIAWEKQKYDALKEADIVSFCHENPSAFDLIVLADVACYFGALGELMQSVSSALSDGGRVFLTLECSDDGQDYALRPSGRFAHSEKYARTVLQTAGLKTETFDVAPLREENGSGVQGIAVVCKKTLKN